MLNSSLKYPSMCSTFYLEKNKIKSSNQLYVFFKTSVSFISLPYVSYMTKILWGEIETKITPKKIIIYPHPKNTDSCTDL